MYSQTLFTLPFVKHGMRQVAGRTSVPFWSHEVETTRSMSFFFFILQLAIRVTIESDSVLISRSQGLPLCMRS